MPYCIGFVDAGYFKAAGARTLGIRAEFEQRFKLLPERQQKASTR